MKYLVYYMHGPTDGKAVEASGYRAKGDFVEFYDGDGNTVFAVRKEQMVAFEVAKD